MSWTREEFEEQMHPCKNCGTLCDGDLCDDICEAEYRESQDEDDVDEEDE